MKIFHVYIMASGKNGTLYVGATSDLAARAARHKAGTNAGFTKRYRVRHLVYFEEVGKAVDAFAREKQLKRWRRSWKLELIEKDNPNWVDLASLLDPGSRPRKTKAVP